MTDYIIFIHLAKHFNFKKDKNMVAPIKSCHFFTSPLAPIVHTPKKYESMSSSILLLEDFFYWVGFKIKE